MNTYLVYLEWPEKCFRVDAEALRLLRARVPKGSRIVRVRNDAEFLKALPKATHVLTWHFKEAWFAKAANLIMLATPGAGRELVALDAPKGVRLHFGRFHGAIMAETAVGFMLAWARGFFRPEARLKWGRREMGDKCYTLAGTKAVIVGYGRVGQAIGRMLALLGVEVFGYARHLQVSARTFDAKLREADWLVMALPSDTGTDDFLDARMIAKLPRRCVVVNVGRGNSVEEDALVRALAAGRLAGAYLDVAKGETFGSRTSVPPLKRRKLPWNLITLPHAAAFDASYLSRAIRELDDDGCL